MIDIEQFSVLQKKSSESFHQQKSLIKKLMAGEKIVCTTCLQPLKLILPTKAQLALPPEERTSNIICTKGCTDIQLDFL